MADEKTEAASRSLVSIIKDFHALDALLIEHGGEVCETIEEWMQINEANLVEKVDGYKLYIEHLETRAAYFKDLKSQANDVQNLIKGMIERMKGNLKFAMENFKTDELSGERFRFKLSKETERIVIEDQDALPIEYTTEKVVFVPDMEKISEALKEGKEIRGVRVEKSRALRSYMNTKGKG